MKPLSKGDTCRVRLHTGEVVEAVYDYAETDGFKNHYLDHKGEILIAVSRPLMHSWECRFVGNPCVLLPVGASV